MSATEYANEFGVWTWSVSDAFKDTSKYTQYDGKYALFDECQKGGELCENCDSKVDVEMVARVPLTVLADVLKSQGWTCEPPKPENG